MASLGARLSIPRSGESPGAPEGGEPEALCAQATRHHGQLPAASSTPGLWPWVSREVARSPPKLRALERTTGGEERLVSESRLCPVPRRQEPLRKIRDLGFVAGS